MQKVLYVGVIAVIVVQVLSGFAVWKPVQLSELAALFGSFQGSRLVHFIGMALIVGFLVVHVALALLVPKTIGAMITGGPVVDDGDAAPTNIHTRRIEETAMSIKNPLLVDLPAERRRRSERAARAQGAGRGDRPPQDPARRASASARSRCSPAVT